MKIEGKSGPSPVLIRTRPRVTQSYCASSLQSGCRRRTITQAVTGLYLCKQTAEPCISCASIFQKGTTMTWLLFFDYSKEAAHVGSHDLMTL